MATLAVVAHRPTGNLMAIPSAGWSLRELKLRKWVLDHPGACKDVSVRCKVSAEYVRLVLYGKRGQQKGKNKPVAGKGTTGKMQEIVRMLKTKGAPL